MLVFFNSMLTYTSAVILSIFELLLTWRERDARTNGLWKPEVQFRKGSPLYCTNGVVIAVQCTGNFFEIYFAPRI